MPGLGVLCKSQISFVSKASHSQQEDLWSSALCSTLTNDLMLRKLRVCLVQAREGASLGVCAL